ncbi:MAG: hypothetical protein ACP5LD_11415 [Desulfomonilaceae bacterium]
MKKICVALIMTIGLSFSAQAHWMLAPDGGVAPDGTVNYVFSAGFPFHVRGPLYPMPKPYWIPPLSDPAANLGRPYQQENAPMLPDKRE